MQSGQCIVTQKDGDSVLGETFRIRIWQLFGSGSGNYSDPETIRIRTYTYDISAFNAHGVVSFKYLYLRF